MKYILFSVLLLAAHFTNYAQSIMSIGKPLSHKGHKQSVKSIKQEIALSLASETIIKAHPQATIDPRKMDSLTSAAKIDSVLKALNEISRVKVLAAAGATQLEKIKEADANISIGLQFRLTKFQRRSSASLKNWIDPHYVYVMFNARTVSSDDSLSLVKSFLFSEIGRRDFVLGYTFQLLDTNNHSIEPTLEVGLNTFRDTSGDHTFKSVHLTTGVRFQWFFDLPTLNTHAYLQLYPYYNLISVDPKYFEDIQVMLGEPDIHPTHHTFGLQTQVQVDNIIFYCNAKYITNRGALINSPDLKRFVYTIGTMIAL